MSRLFFEIDMYQLELPELTTCRLLNAVHMIYTLDQQSFVGFQHLEVLWDILIKRIRSTKLSKARTKQLYVPSLLLNISISLHLYKSLSD